MIKLYAAAFLLLSGCSTEYPPANLTTSTGVDLAPTGAGAASPVVAATPAEVVQAFFTALHADDMDGLQRVMLPSRYEILMEDPDRQRMWIAVWKRCTVVRTGAVPPIEEDATEPITIRLPVDYDCQGQKFSDGIGLTRVDGRWYWDEN